MYRMTTLLSVIAIGILGIGCAPPQTEVHLVNNTSFSVDLQLFYDDDQNLTSDLIRVDGVELNFDLQPGETQSFSRDCEDIQAMFIYDADMRVAPGFSPEADTDVYREPGDFSCGDIVTFTFTQDALGTSLDIGFSQSN